MRLFETFALAAPGHAQGIVEHYDQGDGASAGEQPGAGLKDRIRQQQREQNDRQGSERQQQPVTQAIAARDAFLRQHNEAHRGKTDALHPAAVEQVDENRQGRGQKAEKINRVEEEIDTRLASPT